MEDSYISSVGRFVNLFTLSFNKIRLNNQMTHSVNEFHTRQDGEVPKRPFYSKYFITSSIRNHINSMTKAQV